MKRQLLALGSMATATALALSACTPNNGDSGSGKGGSSDEVKVMAQEAPHSLNTNSNTGNATADADVTYLLDDAFSFYDKDLKLQGNDSFGKVQKTSDKPLKVKYSIADTAKWSDGVPYSAADLVLMWGAEGSNFNTKDADKAANAKGEVKKQSGSNVIFNSGDPGVALMKKFPEISKDNKTAEFEYSKQFADWKLNLTTGDSGLPAHIVAKKALGIDDPDKANQAVIDAFKKNDKKKLAKLANVWNKGFDFRSMPKDKDLLVNTGPYKLTDLKKDEYATLEARDDYKGSRKPKIKKMTIRFDGDPSAAVQALENGEVDMIAPNATADTLKQLKKVDNTSVKTGELGTYGHTDLQFGNGGPFDPKSYGGDKEKAKKVRQAFLLAIPRQKIVNDIFKPLNKKADVRNSFTTVPGSPAYDKIVKDSGIEKAFGKQDLNKAKKLLKEAGVKKPKVRVLFGVPNPRGEQMFQLLKEAADKVGFDTINSSDAKWGEYLADGSKYDASMFSWESTSTGVTESDANFRTGGINNFGHYSNKDVDKLFEQLQGELDPNKQADLEGKIEKHLVDDAFGLPTTQNPQVIAYRNSLHGIDPMTISPTVFWNFYDWSMD